MSDLITKPVLDSIGGWFGLVRSGPSLIELEVPITPVLDVRRIAEIGSGLGIADGWHAFTITVVHAALGTLETAWLMADVIAAAGIDLNASTVWLFDISARPATTPVFTSAFAVTAREQSQGAEYSRLFRRWTGELTTTSGNFGIPVYEWRDPVQMVGKQNYRILVNSTAAAAGTIFFNVLVWIGARGALPPFVP